MQTDLSVSEEYKTRTTAKIAQAILEMVGEVNAVVHSSKLNEGLDKRIETLLERANAYPKIVEKVTKLQKASADKRWVVQRSINHALDQIESELNKAVQKDEMTLTCVLAEMAVNEVFTTEEVTKAYKIAEKFGYRDKWAEKQLVKIIPEQENIEKVYKDLFNFWNRAQ